MATRKPAQINQDQASSPLQNDLMMSGRDQIVDDDNNNSNVKVNQHTLHLSNKQKSTDDKIVFASNDYSRDINTLVENLRRDNYLPVIFIGASNSGKTQIFTSLLSLFQKLTEERNPNGVNITFGPPLVDINTEYGKTSRDFAERHFREVVSNAISGNAEMFTKIPFPFAIPVHLEARVNNQQILQKFAFFEANGEWFHPDVDKETGSYYRQLKPEIQSIFKQFDDEMGVAIVYAAPSDLTSASDEVLDNQEYLKRLRRADESLQVGMNRYLENRSRKDRDKHIFLLTKWDAAKKIQGFSDSIDLKEYDQSKLITSTASEAVGLAGQIANKLYTGSYGLFTSAALVADETQRVFMPYSAGLFSGKYIITAGDNSKFDRFAKGLWNQLMFAAGHELVIFPAPPKVIVPWWRKIMNMVSG